MIYLAYTYRSQSTIEGNQGWDLTARTVEEYYFSPHSGLPTDLQIANFLMQPSTRCSEMVSHCGLGPPMSINNQDNPPQAFPQVYLL